MCVYMEPNIDFEPGPKVFWIWKKCTRVGAKGFKNRKIWIQTNVGHVSKKRWELDMVSS
jgi:hypothetical protein